MLLISSARDSIGIYKKDKFIVLLSLVPVLIGLLLYYYLGNWFFTDVLEWGKQWIQQKISFESFGNILTYIFMGILSVSLFFLINWTFVLFVTVIAGPFNDLISERVENILIEKKQTSIKQSMSKLIKSLFKTLINELKKVFFIVLVTIVALIIGFIPLLAPLSIVITAILFAVEFVDYSWSRHDLNFSSCLKDIKSNFLLYLISGGIFLFLMSIPIVNLFAFSYGVIFFTVLFVKRSQIKMISK